MSEERIYLEPRRQYDKAIIGSMFETGAVCYIIAKVLEILMDEEGMSYDEARDWFCFNMASAYIGIGSPVYIDTEFDL